MKDRTRNQWWRGLAAAGAGLVLSLIVAGCGKGAVDQALDSDANGYLCPTCQSKFFTDREVFANNCPQCKQLGLVQVVGFVCAEDKHVTLGPRGRASMKCEQCGKPTTSMSIPREKDFKAWGAPKKTGPEVGVN